MLSSHEPSQVAGFPLNTLITCPPRWVFLVALIVFEVFFQLSRPLIRVLLQRTTYSVDKVEYLVAYGPSYLVSTIHSMILGVLGVQILWSLWYAPLDYQYAVWDDWVTEEGYARSAYLSFVVCHAFMAYIVYDLMHVLTNWPQLGGWDTVVHHLLFLWCAVINASMGTLPFPFGWMIICELSTPFLNLRWLLIKTDQGNGHLMSITTILLATSFFFTRILGYGLGLWYLAANMERVVAITRQRGFSAAYAWVVFVCLAMGWLLQLAWFVKGLVPITLRLGKRDKDPVKTL
jgi:hypothetical protein